MADFDIDVRAKENAHKAQGCLHSMCVCVCVRVSVSLYLIPLTLCLRTCMVLVRRSSCLCHAYSTAPVWAAWSTWPWRMRRLASWGRAATHCGGSRRTSRTSKHIGRQLIQHMLFPAGKHSEKDRSKPQRSFLSVRPHGAVWGSSLFAKGRGNVQFQMFLSNHTLCVT